MNVSEKLRSWLEGSDRRVGTVVHTLDGKQPVRAERLADGSWKYEKEPWAHGFLADQ